MMRKKSAKLAILMPLAGITFTWVLFLLAAWVDLFYPFPSYDEYGNSLTGEPPLRFSTYLFLLGITMFALSALNGQRMALLVRAEQDSPLARSAHRFNNLAVILSLIAGAVFAVGTFLGAFNNYDSREASLLIRILGVYVPIILATALVVYVLLSAFVFRKDAPDLRSEEQDENRVKLQRAIGLAYALPIIGTAIAIIFGLVVYDITKTDLDVWIWVIIQAIIAGSILLGTRFASRARLSKPLPPKERRTGVAAVNLNLVLSIVFAVVVTGMAFGFGLGAIDELRQWPEWTENKPYQQPTVRPFEWLWFFQKLLPALVLLALAEFGTYRTLIVRNRDLVA